MDFKVKSDPEIKDELPESSKDSMKKMKKDGTARKRTKTGCKTCRKRRVKCDEARPVCKNCVKSRRICTWHDPTQTPQDQRPTFRPMSHVPHYQQRLSFALPSIDHAAMQYSNSLAALSSIATLGADLQLNAFASGASSYYDQSPDVEWPNYMSPSLPGEVTPWMMGQQNWVPTQPIGSHFYHRGLQTSSNPELHTAAYSAYPGMPPNSNFTNWHDDVSSGPASSVPPDRESSAAQADVRKSSLRSDAGDVNYAASPHLSVPRAPPPSIARTISYQDPSPRQRLHSLSEETEDSEDSWDETSEDNSGEDSALVNLRSAQALAIDERKAYLLRHFVNNIRPCLSLSEPPLAFDGSSTWGEIIPSLALSCPGLLHGIMAASALHLAVLHGTNEMVPTKHLMIASKRLQKLLATPSSRHQLQTLSLCLLLAWYEVMNGDHARWIMHLGGASSFLLEHIRTARVSDDMLFDEDFRVDEMLVEKLTGLSVQYNSQDRGKSLQNDMVDSYKTSNSTREWKSRLDLFWWYVKMDIFHAFLSGDQLLLPYKNWNMCPPRGRIGLKSKAHASVDHLWLVLARLADFGGKDRLRKQRQVVASGGQWKPPPGFLQPVQSGRGPVSGTSQKDIQDPNAPSANEGRARIHKTAKQSPSTKKGPPMNFYGMMPPPTIPPSMLSSFHVNDAELRKNSNVQTSVPKETPVVDLKLETERALAEHSAIDDAFNLWRSALGADFEPLPDEPADTDCPFSPILRYDDPLVACMWSLYYLGRILLRRYHPHSPPAMIVSAGVNAHFTAQDAEIIGSINVGLLKSQAELAKAGSINPTLVAALQEMTFPLMFAGVQYQNAQQRSWTIDNLVEIAESAGWKSAYAVASALESAWAAQSDNERGPPYERTLGMRGVGDATLRERRRVVAMDNMYRSPESEHESRFVSHDRGLITKHADARAFWAMGVLSSADDVQEMFSELKVRR